MNKKKKNFEKVNLNDKTKILIPARRECNCQAQYHQLINNCMTCGKVVCEQEGEGPCFFCGNIILRPDADLARHEIFEQMKNEETIFEIEYKKAKAHKDNLVNLDRNSQKQSNIYDEQTDWFSINDDVYMSKEARNTAMREIIKINQEQEENDKVIHLKFKGFEDGFTEEKPIVDKDKQKADAQDYEREVNQREVEERNKKLQEKAEDWSQSKTEIDTLHQSITQEYSQKYGKFQKSSKGEGVPKTLKPLSKVVRLEEEDEFKEMFERSMNEANSKTKFNPNDYDEEIYDLERNDKGMCLSMLQPWASLLVEGFKRFEGRHWSHGFRGPLWIHAGATPPSSETVKAVETQYKVFYKNVQNAPSLPERYPTGSLIGIVDLQTILTNKEYNDLVREEFREESSSDFIFVVRNPRKLQLPIKMSGNKDIYQIDEDLRKTATKCLKKVKTSWFKYIARQLKTDNSMVISKEIKSSVTRKYEICGIIISGLLNESELLRINNFAKDSLNGKKNIGKKHSGIVDLNNNFPQLDKLLAAFPDEKRDSIKMLTNGEVFYLNKKEKPFIFDKNYALLLNIGSELEIHVDDTKAHTSKTFHISDGQIIILEQENKEITFIKVDSEGESIYEMKRDACNLLVLLSM